MKTIIADTHEYGADPINIDYPQDAILLGDIVDRKNCLPEQLAEATARMKYLKEMFGNNYITGNHECNFENTQQITGGVLFTHGDIPLYGDPLWRQRRLTTPGAGSFMRFFKMLGSKFRRIWPFVGRNKIQTLADYANHWVNVHTIVVGHVHPTHLVDEKVGDIRVIIVPRGKTEVDLWSGTEIL